MKIFNPFNFLASLFSSPYSRVNYNQLLNALQPHKDEIMEYVFGSNWRTITIKNSYKKFNQKLGMNITGDEYSTPMSCGLPLKILNRWFELEVSKRKFSKYVTINKRLYVLAYSVSEVYTVHNGIAVPSFFIAYHHALDYDTKIKTIYNCEKHNIHELLDYFESKIGHSYAKLEPITDIDKYLIDNKINKDQLLVVPSYCYFRPTMDGESDHVRFNGNSLNDDQTYYKGVSKEIQDIVGARYAFDDELTAKHFNRNNSVVDLDYLTIVANKYQTNYCTPQEKLAANSGFRAGYNLKKSISEFNLQCYVADFARFLADNTILEDGRWFYKPENTHKSLQELYRLYSGTVEPILES